MARISVYLFCGTLAATIAFDAASQAFPSKPIRFITAGVGGGNDFTARLIAPELSAAVGQPVVVDNRANSTIAAEAVARSAPDGYALLVAGGTFTIGPLMQQVPYDVLRDFAPVVLTGSAPNILTVHPSLPVKSVKDLIALARSNPGKLNYASAGVGNLQHLGMEHLQALAKVKMNHVPYKGAAPAFIDTLSGRIDLQFANIVGVLPHVENKRVRAIAISASRGASVLPDVPGVSATLPAFDLDGWMGLFVRAGTPQDIIAKLHRDLAAAVQSPDYRERFAKRGADVVVGGPEGLAKIVRDEIPLYASIIKSAQITAE